MRCKVTCTLLNAWLRATDADASEEDFSSFLAVLERQKRPVTRAMQMGIDFESLVNSFVEDGSVTTDDEASYRAACQFGRRLNGAQLQVWMEKPVTIAGMDFQLVGVADALHAGIISDIKRVQRYEYGKYQHSTQHPMYMELFPEAIRFDYLIFDGQYCYREQYRRGDFLPIESTIKAFLDYLTNADLMDIYKNKWRID